MWIKREIASILRQQSNRWPCLVLVGARQTGKTTLLRRTFPKHHYLSLDHPRDAAQADEDGEEFLRLLGEPAIIDEVQYAPGLFRHLKVAIDAHRQRRGRFLLTGSQRFAMMQGVSESLAGRIAVIELLSLSTRELEKAFDLVAQGDQLIEWIVVGGYPEIHAQQIPVYEFFANYVATYIERDVRRLINVKSSRDFDRFMRMCALRTANLISMNAMASDLGVAAPTIKSWLDVLVASNVVALVEPYLDNPNRRLVKSPKLFFLDTGLCCHLLNIRTPADLLASPFLGAIFETHVYGQLLRAMRNRAIIDPIYFFRDRDGHEIDFVLPRAGKAHLIECKWSDAPLLDMKNIEVFKKVYGEESVLSYNIVCRARGRHRRSRDGLVIRDSVAWEDLVEIEGNKRN